MKKMKRKTKEVLTEYLDWKCNTYYVLDELGYPTSTELYELLYLFKKEWSNNVDTLTNIVEDFIERQQ